MQLYQAIDAIDGAFHRCRYESDRETLKENFPSVIEDFEARIRTIRDESESINFGDLVAIFTTQGASKEYAEKKANEELASLIVDYLKLIMVVERAKTSYDPSQYHVPANKISSKLPEFESPNDVYVWWNHRVHVVQNEFSEMSHLETYFLPYLQSSESKNHCFEVLTMESARARGTLHEMEIFIENFGLQEMTTLLHRDDVTFDEAQEKARSKLVEMREEWKGLTEIWTTKEEFLHENF